MKVLKIVAILTAVLLLLGCVFVLSGLYNMAADQPHSRLVLTLIQTLRDRSIAAHAVGINAPKLDDPALIAEGAEHYAGMCTGCHLAPGKHDSEIRPGLYPRPPNLTERRGRAPAQDFWIIKHGIKLSAMPAWGTTHDDAAIWGIVAFLQKMPTLSIAEYQELTAHASDEEGESTDSEQIPVRSTNKVSK